MNRTSFNSNPETSVFVAKNMLKRFMEAVGKSFRPAEIQIKKALPVGRAHKELDGMENY